MHKIKFLPLGDNALTIEFGNTISKELNDQAVNLFHYFEKNRFAGMIETVPSYSSLTIFYDVIKVRKTLTEYPTAFETVRHFAEDAIHSGQNLPKYETRLIEIPVAFSGELALDLDFVASINNLTAEKVVEIFTAQTYRVYMLGFLPAFPYMGEVDERIAAPRKRSPRRKVPQGSVGIAGRQTGIYPFDSPGGWQIIGRTDFELFTPNAESPSALKAGDLVRFYDSKK